MSLGPPAIGVLAGLSGLHAAFEILALPVVTAFVLARLVAIEPASAPFQRDVRGERQEGVPCRRTV